MHGCCPGKSSWDALVKTATSLGQPRFLPETGRRLHHLLHLEFCIPDAANHFALWRWCRWTFAGSPCSGVDELERAIEYSQKAWHNGSPAGRTELQRIRTDVHRCASC